MMLMMSIIWWYLNVNDDKDVNPIIAIIGSGIVGIIVNSTVIIIVVVLGVNFSVGVGVAANNNGGSNYNSMLVVLYLV